MKNLSKSEAEKNLLEADKFRDIPLTKRNDFGTMICITDILMERIPFTATYEIICIYYINEVSCPETGLTGYLDEILTLYH